MSVNLGQYTKESNNAIISSTVIPKLFRRKNIHPSGQNSLLFKNDTKKKRWEKIKGKIVKKYNK